MTERQASNVLTQEEIIRLKLPRNRVQSFFDIFANNFSRLFASGFVFAFFALPMMIVLGINNIIVYDIKNQMAAAAISESEGARLIFDTINAANLLLIPMLVVLAVGVAGLIRLTRRLVWQQDISFWHDFGRGVKENVGSIIMVSVMIGTINFVMQLLARYGYFIAASGWYDIALATSIVAFALIVVIGVFVLFQTDIYNLTFFAKIKNGFLLAMRTAPATFALFIAVFSPWVIFWIPMDDITYFVLLGVMLLIVAPLELLSLHEYLFHVFDRFINRDHHPDIYGKGLYR